VWGEERETERQRGRRRMWILQTWPRAPHHARIRLSVCVCVRERERERVRERERDKAMMYTNFENPAKVTGSREYKLMYVCVRETESVCVYERGSDDAYESSEPGKGYGITRVLEGGRLWEKAACRYNCG